jgi:hypothetical protein
MLATDKRLYVGNVPELIRPSRMSGTRQHTCKYDKQSRGEHERWPPFTGELSHYHPITSDGSLIDDVNWLDLPGISLIARSN